MTRAVIAAILLCLFHGLPLMGGAIAQVPPPIGEWEDDERISARLGLTDWSVQALPPLPPPERAGADIIHIRVRLDDVEYDLVLTPHSVRSPAFRVLLCDGQGGLVEAPPPGPSGLHPERLAPRDGVPSDHHLGVMTYRGQIVQLPQSRVAATIRNGELDATILMSGVMARGEDAWFIEPLARTLREAPMPPAGLHIAYRAADAPADGQRCGGALPAPLLPAGGLGGPGGAGGAGGGAGGTGGAGAGGRGDGPDSPLICEIAIDADYAYFQQNSGSIAQTTSDVETIMNSVSLIYEADVDVAFEITDLIIRTTNAPYTAGVSSMNLLNQFRNHWNANHTSVRRNIAHLFSGTTTNDPEIVGRAFLGSVCDMSFGYGYSRSRFTGTMSRRVGLHAHEIGHNFNADHCNEPSQPCSPCAIMCSSIGGCGGDTSTFGCSTSSISSFAQSRPCLSTGCTEPVITAHPGDRTVEVGQRATFSVSASGSGTLAYQWRRDGQNLANGGAISGATSSTLVIDPASPSHAGQYTCIVNNSCGSAASSAAMLTVDTCDPPQITAHPSPRTAPEGGVASFTVAAEGSAPLAYQWRRDGHDLVNGGAISGAGTATLTIDPVAAAHAGEYTCVVSNACGAAVSSSAALTVGQCDHPAITANPASQVVPQGSTGVLSIAATGDEPLAFRWRRDGVPLSDGEGGISGAATPSLTINPAASEHTGLYDCLVSNPCGEATSSAAMLTVSSPPAIATQPSSSTVCVGQRAVLSVEATGSTPLAYQWRRNGQNLASAPHISGINSPTLIIDPVKAGDAGNYTVAVSNIAGAAMSQQAILDVGPQAMITQQPASMSIPSGRRATFSAAAQGDGLSYRWQRNGQDLDHLPPPGSPPRIFGMDTASLTITPTRPADAGEYTVHIEHACGEITSYPAILTITEGNAGTIAWWRFEEGSRGNGLPGPFRNNDRAISEVNSPALDMMRARGRPRYVTDTPGPEVLGVGPNRLAMRFEGGDALRAAASGLLNFGAVSAPGGEFTIEMFVKIEPAPENAAAYRLLQKLDAPQGVGYDLMVSTGAGAGGAAGGGGAAGTFLATASDGVQSTTQTTQARIDDGRWRHIAWRRYFDGQTGRLEIFVDYQLHEAATGEVVSGLASGADLWMGRGDQLGASDYLIGWLDEVRISDRPLLPSEFLRTSEGMACYANCTESTTEPNLTILDFVCFIERFAEAQSLPYEEQVHHYANCDGSAAPPILTINDFVCFINRFHEGCSE